MLATVSWLRGSPGLRSAGRMSGVTPTSPPPPPTESEALEHIAALYAVETTSGAAAPTNVSPSGTEKTGLSSMP
jgi:hypothetical protein